MVDLSPRKVSQDDVGLIEGFIRSIVSKGGFNGVVLGLSGGVDSAVVSTLCTRALGGDVVHNVFLPADSTPKYDWDLTSRLSRELGTKYEIIPIQGIIDSFSNVLHLDNEEILRKGNIAARCRMAILFDYAKKHGCIVAGTSNKSEMMMGYFTKFGDGASDFMPIVGLYKTQVWDVARMLEIPSEIVDRAPSASLWDGQTDEGDMGISYLRLDEILNGMSKSLDDSEIAGILGLSTFEVLAIRNRVRDMGHKGSPTPALKFE